MTPFPRPEYATLTRYAPDRRPVALDLSDNTNLWGTHPEAMARISRVETDDLARYPELYADALREAVAERFGVDPGCVTTGAGSDDVLDSAFRAAGGEDATVAYAAPTFSMVEPLATMNGMDARAVPWPEALADPTLLLVGAPAVVYVCRPNNPTGELAPLAWVESLLTAREEAGDPSPLVIIDEAYADFAGETLVGHAAEHDGVLVARTTSKAFGLAGIRCGFGVASLATALEIEKSRGPYKVSRLATDAAALAIRDADGWVAKVVEECRRNRDRLYGELAARGLRPIESYANFLLFAAPGGDAAADALALRELDVAVRPFTDIPGLGDGLRVTVGPWPVVETFLDALDRMRATSTDGSKRGAGEAVER